MSKASFVVCSSCLYFTKRKLYEKTCSDLGVLRVQKPCGSFEPNYTDLRSSVGGQNLVTQLISIVNRLPEDNSAILASLIQYRTRLTRHTDFRLFQPVYFRYQGRGTYLSHYCKAYVLDGTKNEIRLINKGGTITASVANRNTKVKSVLTVAEFREVRDRLLAQDRLVDPNQDGISSSSKNNIIPSIDTVHKEKVANFETKRSNVHKLTHPKTKTKAKGKLGKRVRIQ